MGLRRGLFVAWMYATLAVLALAATPTLLMPPSATLAFVRAWMKLVLWGLRRIMGVRVEIRGLEHLPRRPVLVAGKHQSMLDTIAPFVALGTPVYVLKQELIRLPVYGALAAHSGMIAVDRDGMHFAILDARLFGTPTSGLRRCKLIIAPAETASFLRTRCASSRIICSASRPTFRSRRITTVI